MVGGMWLEEGAVSVLQLAFFVLFFNITRKSLVKRVLPSVGHSVRRFVIVSVTSCFFDQHEVTVCVGAKIMRDARADY